MFQCLWKWLKGEDVTVTVMRHIGYSNVGRGWEHTQIQLPTGHIRCVKGCIGVEGQQITVNTREMWKY
jgi:hypothetical protein